LKRSNVIWSWSARVAWVLLPVIVGTALADAFDDWSHATIVVASVLLWAGWLAGAVALFAPRPWGFAVLRVVAPTAVVVALLADASGPARAAATGVAFVAAVLALGAPIARASANALAYGTEDRYPLTVPPTLGLAPLPIAIAVVAFGVSMGPLLLADGRVAAGLVALVVGFPLAGLAANSIRALSQRWLVLVPAGIVAADPLTLADPVLVPREEIVAATPGTRTPVPALDLRLGPARGAVTFVLREPAPFVRRRGRVDAGLVRASAFRVGIVDRRTFCNEAPRRGIPVGDYAAMPPPSTTSPS
jgi:hypothetical protein